MKNLNSGLVACDCSEGVMEISLCRPDRKNALNQAMYRELADVIGQAVADADTRVLLLSGSDGCFTSGNDLVDFANAPELISGVNPGANPIVRFMTALAHCPKPVVVAVEGVAVGIGTTLLLHADLVYAAPDASFRLPFANLGLCPEYASSWLLPRLVGHAKAAEWLLLGEFFTAEDARAAGLINGIVDKPVVVARNQAQKLASQPPVAVTTAKALMKQGSATEIESAMQRELREFARALQGDEFKAAVQAFFNKQNRA